MTRGASADGGSLADCPKIVGRLQGSWRKIVKVRGSLLPGLVEDLRKEVQQRGINFSGVSGHEHPLNDHVIPMDAFPSIEFRDAEMHTSHAD